MKYSKVCKYHKENGLCEPKQEYEYLKDYDMVGAILSLRCPKDSGTDGKCNRVCFEIE